MITLWTNADFDVMRQGLSKDNKKLRHDLRYACFRVQNELKGGAKADTIHQEIAERIEKLDNFEGWSKFAITWDISTPDPVVLVKRKWSIYQEWDQTLERIAVPLEFAKSEVETTKPKVSRKAKT